MYLGEPLIQQDPMGLKRVLSPDYQGTVPDGPLLVRFFRQLNFADRYMTDGVDYCIAQRGNKVDPGELSR